MGLSCVLGRSGLQRICCKSCFRVSRVMLAGISLMRVNDGHLGQKSSSPPSSRGRRLWEPLTTPTIAPFSLTRGAPLCPGSTDPLRHNPVFPLCRCGCSSSNRRSSSSVHLPAENPTEAIGANWVNARDASTEALVAEAPRPELI